ncbi:MAG: hypothetical protein ACXADF_04795 [Candidatus Thorarchaeota archaeon]
MSHRAKVTLDWLRKGRPLDDSTIIRHIMLDAVQREINEKRNQLGKKAKDREYSSSLADWQEKIELSPTLFECEFDLAPLQLEAISSKVIDDALGSTLVHQEVSRRETPVIPTGETLEEQIRSLLPSCLDKTISKMGQKQKSMKQKKKSLVNFLSRVTLNSLPESKDWPIVPIGLDPFSSALYTIHFIAKASNNQIPWLILIWKYEIERYRNELLSDLLGSLTKEITIGEVRNKLRRASEDIKADLGTRDPLVGWIHEWQNRIKEKDYKANMKLIDCFRRDEKEGAEAGYADTDSSEDNDDESSTTDLRRILKQDVLELIDPPSGGVQTPQTPLPRSLWAQASIIADNPLAYMYEEFLSSLRTDLNSLRFGQLVNTCKYMAESEKPGKPTAKEIADVSNVDVRSIQMNSIGLTLTERYIPSLMDMGLRYRYIFTRMRKSAISSDGLAERITISETDLYQVATKHLEPKVSQGPNDIELADDSFHLAVESDLISVRLDLFDRDSGSWRETPGKDSTLSTKSAQSLIRKTAVQVRRITMPTQREIDLISILSSINASSKGIKWVFESLDFPSRTMEHVLSDLLGTGRLRLLYHPSLNYAGLPEGFIVAAQFKSVKRLDSFINWLASSVPYAHIQFSRDEKSLVSQVRVPRFSKSDGLIKQELQKQDALKAIGTIARNRTYQMSVFHRLYQSKKHPWKDPWEAS